MPKLHKLRNCSREACIRNSIILVFILFAIQLLANMIFYKDYNVLTMVGFKWFTEQSPVVMEANSDTNAYLEPGRSQPIGGLPVNKSIRGSGSDVTRGGGTSTRTVKIKTPPELCPVIPPGLRGSVQVDKVVRSWAALESKYASNLYKGGRWKPSVCQARHRVAIIIPYRDREMHLKLFLQHMHPFLQRQQLDYGIFVIELAPKTKFNRALLMNIGYAEAAKLYDYQCFVFHDVDLYPEDDRNIYSCPEFPRHMSVAIDKFKYILPYDGIFGGVCAIKKEHFILINGFSNKFFGWGGEDDDMHNRIVNKHLKIIRYRKDIARYTMMSHKDDTRNPERWRLLRKGKFRWEVDGINSLIYTTIAYEFRQLYVWINVDFDKDVVMKYNATSIKQYRELLKNRTTVKTTQRSRNMSMNMPLKTRTWPNVMTEQRQDFAFRLLSAGKHRWEVDGVNSLIYTVIATEFRPLYTWINVDVDEHLIMTADPKTIQELLKKKATTVKPTQAHQIPTQIMPLKSNLTSLKGTNIGQNIGQKIGQKTGQNIGPNIGTNIGQNISKNITTKT